MPSSGSLSAGHQAQRDGFRWQALIEIAAIVAVFFVAAGDPAPHVNEQHYLSRLKHFWDPGWCAGDFFLETPDAHFTIVWLAGWTTLAMPLPAVAWGGRLLAWGLIAWAWQRLSWALTPTPWAAVLGAAIWVVGIAQGNLAGEWVVGGVEAKCFAYAFVLLALEALVRDRWNAAWTYLGVASAFHVLVGGWSVVVFLGIWATTANRPPLRTMAQALAVGGVIALAGIVPPLAMNAGAPSEVVAEANRIYVFDRLPHHLALLSMRESWLADRATRHLVVMLALAGAIAWASKRRSQSADAHDNRLLRICRFALGAAVLALVGVGIETVLADSPLTAAKLQRYYWYRLTDAAAPLAVGLVVSVAITEGIQKRQASAVVGLVALLIGVSSVLGWQTWRRASDPRAPSEKRITDLEAWADICAWVRDETPTDAVFLVPRQANSFKWRAHRGEVVNQKDIPQNAAGIVQWRERMTAVYKQTTADGRVHSVRSLGHLGEARLRELGDAYGADFVLTTNEKRLRLPVRYRNRRYVVYDLGVPAWP